MSHTFVKDVMISDLVSLDVSTTIKDTARLMEEKEIGCVIVTENDSPIGIVTERDFVKKVASHELSLSSSIREAMSSPLIVIDPEETIWEAAQIMNTNNIHKLPVKQDNGIVGIVTTSDLVKICSSGSDSEMRKICDQILSRMQNS